MFSKASASVYVTSEGGPDTRLNKGMKPTEGKKYKAVALSRDSQGRCCVAVDAVVSGRHLHVRQEARLRSHSSRVYSSVREGAIFILHRYPFYFLFQFFASQA